MGSGNRLPILWSFSIVVLLIHLDLKMWLFSIVELNMKNHMFVFPILLHEKSTISLLVQFPTPLLLPCLQIKAIWFHHSCVISYTHAWVSLLHCQKYKQQYTGWSCCIYSLCGSWFLKLKGFDNKLSWASLDKWSSWSNDTGKFLNLNPFVLLCSALNSQLITRKYLDYR